MSITTLKKLHSTNRDGEFKEEGTIKGLLYRNKLFHDQPSEYSLPRLTTAGFASEYPQCSGTGSPIVLQGIS